MFNIKNINKISKPVLILGMAIIIIVGIFIYRSVVSEGRYFISKFDLGKALQTMGIEDSSSTLIFVGDIMLSRNIGKLMLENDNWSYPFLKISDILGDADITFGNLEGPISNRGIKVGSIYSFRADPRSVEGLVYSGFDILSVANNHIWDYGVDAFTDTLKVLKDSGISYVGGGSSYEEAHKPIIMETKGTKVAYLAYTNLLPSFLGAKDAKLAVAFPDMEQMMIDVQKARDRADVVAVSFHWGYEYKTHHNPYQEGLAHAAIDAGADLVVGHHPHVVQDTEKYGGGYIAYSLGNFVFDQNFSEDTGSGLMLRVIIRDKKIAEIERHVIRFTPSFQPFIAPMVRSGV